MTRMLPSSLGEVTGDVVFATVSGAHLYGFPSADSDVDLCGVQPLPIEEVVGLRPGEETVGRTWTRDGVEVDIVTHDLAEFARLMLRRNGHVLEQLLSPLVIVSSPAHEELIGLAPDRERLAAAMTARRRDRSSLPDRPTAEPALHDLVVRTRRQGPASARPSDVNSRSQG